jgi:hypothetical protein
LLWEIHDGLVICRKKLFKFMEFLNRIPLCGHLICEFNLFG